MAADVEGIIDVKKIYTHRALAKTLGRDDRWVVEKLLANGFDFYTVCQTHFISGRRFQLFVERNSVSRIKKKGTG